MVTFFPLRDRPLFSRMVIAAIFFIISFSPGFSQPVKQHRNLQWTPVKKLEIGPADSIQVLSFRGAASQMEVHGFLPVYLEKGFT